MEQRDETEDPTVEIARRSDMPGRLVSRYRLLEKLGAGRSTAVYRACDDTTGRVLAFKQLLGSAQAPGRAWQEAMFQREYHTLIRLKHPRVVEVYDYGVGEAGPFYTMELVEGQDLRQLAPLPVRDACAYARDLAWLLALLQAHRLVHRDISPRTVRITAAGCARLIDFGTLHSFGVSDELVGTPAFVAPEGFFGMPLDPRTDLFSLGALLYFCLTGRLAFAAQALSELPAIWQTPPLPPSHWAPQVPQALDGLLLALLSVNPALRPGSAAEVIDRLEAIAELEPQPHALPAEHYLRAAPLVGRELEQRWMSERVADTLAGRGGAAVLSGPFGIGKTRLLHELALEAQRAAVVVLKVDAEALSVPFGVATALALQLATRCPELARNAAGPSAALLGQLSPVLAARLGVERLPPLSDAPFEHRARLRDALGRWFSEVSRIQALSLAVDNVQASDEDSCAVLATLSLYAAPRKLLVLCTRRSGEAAVAPAPLSTLYKHATAVELSGLSAAACRELVDAVFGAAENRDDAACLLHQHTSGNPQHCIELVQLWVRERLATYGKGKWQLPRQSLSGSALQRLEHIAASRLAALANDARRMAEVLSIHDRPISLELCLAFAEAGPEQAHWALQELVSAQLVVGDRGCYRFAHEPVREAVLAAMDEGTRRALHLRAAEVLLALPGMGVSERLQAGFHLIEGGDESAGADLLAGAARRFLAGDGSAGTPNQVAPLLQVALDVYDRERRSEAELCGLLFPLIAVAFSSSDWPLIRAHGERAIDLGLRVTGLGLAETLRARLGRPLALSVGLVRAGAALRARKQNADPTGLRELLVLFCTAIPAVLSTLATCNDVAAVERITQKLHALTLFGPGHLVSLIHQLAVNQLRIARGCFGEALGDEAEIKALIVHPKLKQTLGEARWSFMYGGVLLTAAQLHAYGFGAHALRLADEASGLGIASLAGWIDAQRLLYHAFRGESEQASEYRQRIELHHAMAASSLWQVEILLSISLFNVDVLAGDATAARRGHEQLARHAARIPGLHVYGEAARAGYMMLRGQYEEAIAIYEQLLPQLPPRGGAGWLSVRCHFGQCLNRAGEHLRARRVLSEAIGHIKAADERIAIDAIEPRRQLALASAGLGDCAGALRTLDELIERHRATQHPLMLGLLHEAAAEVALQAGSASDFLRHFTELRRHFGLSKNPLLIARCEQLFEAALRAGVASQAQAEQVFQLAPTDDIYRALHEIALAVDPCECALRVLLARSGASSGYLYRMEADRLALVARSDRGVPPPELEAQLGQRMLRAASEQAALEPQPTRLQLRLSRIAEGNTREAAPPAGPDAPVQRTVIVEALADRASRSGFQASLLRSSEGPSQWIGALILRDDERDTRPLSEGLLQAIAHALSLRVPSAGEDADRGDR